MSAPCYPSEIEDVLSENLCGRMEVNRCPPEEKPWPTAPCLVLLCAPTLLAGCASETGGNRRDTMTQRQRDSVLSTTGLPGAPGVAKALAPRTRPKHVRRGSTPLPIRDATQ